MIIKRKIEKFLQENLGIKNKNVVNRLASCGKVLHLKEKEILFCQDCKPDYMAFLLNGIMRSFVINEKGQDLTECFDFQQGCAVCPSIPMNAPASVNVESSVDSDLLVFPIDEIWELVNTDVEISQMYNIALCYSMQKYVKFTRVLLKFNTTQRYKWFLSEYAELNGKVKNKDIASFLNMTPATLCAVKKKLQL